MKEHQISLAKDIYQDLLVAAQSSGMTPENWIAAQLPKKTEPRKKEMQWQQLQKVFGAWENNSELDKIYANIDQERHDFRGRELDFESFE